MKALVTGGFGFVGSHMVDLLLECGFDVTVVDNLVTGKEENLQRHPHLTAWRMDVCDLKPASSFFEGIDYVFHFAGLADIVPSVERPADYVQTNTLGTARVLEAARHAGVKRVVYAASSSCYGIDAPTPTDEHAPIAPAHPYALSKYQGEQLALHWHAVYGLSVSAVRIFSAYGPRIPIVSGATGSGVHSAFSVFLAQKLHDKPFTVVGDGKQGRDWVYVGDVARAFLRVAEEGRPGEVYNCGYGAPHTVEQLVGLLEGEVTHIPKRPGEPQTTWANTAKLRALDWSALVPFEVGVGRTLRDIDRWSDAVAWEPDTLEAATRTWFQALERIPA